MKISLHPSQAPELLLSVNQSISDTSDHRVTQTALPSSILLANLIPAILLLIYALHILHRILQFWNIIAIKRPFGKLGSKLLNIKGAWTGRSRRKDGYVHINTHCSPDGGRDRGECSDGSYEEIELGGEQMDGPGNGNGMDILTSDPATTSDLLSAHECEYSATQYTHLDSPNDPRRETSPYGQAPFPKEQQMDEFDISKYIDSEKLMFRDGVLAVRSIGSERGCVEEGENGEEEDGSLSLRVHRTVDWAVDKAICWLEG
ncbi:hypothetical protein PAAG_04182 [Paracoccidioides lutzii Pb01]|uniref:Uncharacterized protein n=1 Tax=Paracoccidioides lutzii (strain ATCC MYA-826 / Pb01) TaxID=502779 RepID=C1H088_PARBA|nr:hypothetical protein PAAG_04182 [Paracoccidioides lutzii Pb01]EEH33129.1 hypothetical protein PAAG_04182 [Paracoccidioides lutzii Pb01]